MNNNLRTYQKSNIAKSYGSKSDLQKPEQVILDKYITPVAENMVMLDIGVGGGRTTLHFAPLVREYVGVDYSQEMITECNKRFTNDIPNARFSLCDVMDMGEFADETFDFVMFSFNGIDSLNHEDRIQAFAEIRRVTKSGGYFCFSTHNLASIHKLFSVRYQLTRHPVATYYKLKRWHLLRRIYNEPFNIDVAKAGKYKVIKDGAHGFELSSYYVALEEQLRQLEGLFSDIKTFSLSDGYEFKNLEVASISDDAWLYYLCKAN